MAAMIKWQGISRTNNILSNPNFVTIGIGKCQSPASPATLHVNVFLSAVEY